MKIIPDKQNYSLAHRLDAITEFNDWKNDTQNIVVDSGQTPTTSTSDVHQMSKAISANAAVATFYSCANIGDAYTLTPIDDFRSPPAYIDGMEIRFRPSGSNSGAATINVNSLGIKNIKKEDGTTDIDAATLVTTKDAYLRYDLSNGCFIFLTFSSSGGGGAGTVSGFVQTFTNASISGGYITFTHGLSSTNIAAVTIKNDLAKGVLVDWEVIDTDNVRIDMAAFGVISGTWEAVISAKV